MPESVLPRCVALCLATTTPSLNQWQRLHYHRRRDLRRAFGKELLVARQASSRAPWLWNAKGPRRVTIVRYGTRLLDQDNLYGGLKPLVDAMKDVGLIEDDTPELLQLQAEQRKVADRRQAGTVIQIQAPNSEGLAGGSCPRPPV